MYTLPLTRVGRFLRDNGKFGFMIAVSLVFLGVIGLPVSRQVSLWLIAVGTLLVTVSPSVFIGARLNILTPFKAMILMSLTILPWAILLGRMIYPAWFFAWWGFLILVSPVAVAAVSIKGLARHFVKGMWGGGNGNTKED